MSSALTTYYSLSYTYKRKPGIRQSTKYNQNNQVEEDEMGGSCSTNGEKRNAYRLLVGKSQGKRPLGRPRCRWVDNIRMDLGEVGWGDVD
jgi:hypothetical protein